MYHEGDEAPQSSPITRWGFILSKSLFPSVHWYILIVQFKTFPYKQNCFAKFNQTRNVCLELTFVHQLPNCKLNFSRHEKIHGLQLIYLVVFTKHNSFKILVATVNLWFIFSIKIKHWKKPSFLIVQQVAYIDFYWNKDFIINNILSCCRCLYTRASFLHCYGVYGPG